MPESMFTVEVETHLKEGCEMASRAIRAQEMRKLDDGTSARLVMLRSGCLATPSILILVCSMLLLEVASHVRRRWKVVRGPESRSPCPNRWTCGEHLVAANRTGATLTN